MEKATVVVIGGGATGVGILRDLAMRGVDVLLLEKLDMVNGTSSRYHGLLHSGARYAVKDQEAARECIEENSILRKIGKSCVEATEGLFIRLPEDDADFEGKWVDGCKKSGITAIPITPQEAWQLEPNLSHQIIAAYRVPDAAIDGFRMAWQNIDSAARYGGRVQTYTEVMRIVSKNGKVIGVDVRNYFTKQTYFIACDFVVNAAGPWSGQIAALAGLDVNVQPDKGTLIAFNQRISSRIVNRLHVPSDGDIFVPHGSITILGTTSMSVKDPEDTSSSFSEIESLLQIGEKTFENLRKYRVLRAFAGSRPLYSASGGKGRGASRGFVILDHLEDGLDGFMTITGGKFTTYRLMAEKMTDIVCKKLQVTTPCRTAEEALVPEVTEEVKTKARKYFPAYGTELAASRLGADRFQRVVERLEKNPDERQLVCECENVTMAEIEEVIKEGTSFTLSDIRRKTRMGMGTCQGNFCSLRSVGILSRAESIDQKQQSLQQLQEFLQARWKGIRPVLWGNALRETEMARGIYGVGLNVNGGSPK
ncbi:anaerobic glycerol-3-phosphate dehydrogenase subunit GlpA [Propionispira raffinosivorans]|uniref:anaerobic glycerol-3-phosphate dehydrogenase subunit GlpA n=1 Tax=Propionispira raffinosivorans TaxID=86959 RepID=UPI0003770C90|nr:anaerobic glycerol-3-phosphate dehydrogenase subunit GlpA [Propionispira raffinosivorans]